VFAVGHPLLAPLGRETAALLACSTPAVLSHLTAARLWDLPAPESEKSTSPSIAATRPNGPEFGRTESGGLPMTTFAATTGCP
jgi:hypothetical protein